jgi:fucose permease
MKENKSNHSLLRLLPILFSFFIMGFADIVGISVSYIKKDFRLNDSIANLLPMFVFLWFAICSLPVGVMMKRIGRKKTAFVSVTLTIIGMLIPLFRYSFPALLIAFALLGIGNTIWKNDEAFLFPYSRGKAPLTPRYNISVALVCPTHER